MSNRDNDQGTIQLTIHWTPSLQATRPPSPAEAYKSIGHHSSEDRPTVLRKGGSASDIAYSQGTAQGSSPKSPPLKHQQMTSSHQKAEESFEQERKK